MDWGLSLRMLNMQFIVLDAACGLQEGIVGCTQLQCDFEHALMSGGGEIAHRLVLSLRRSLV